MRKNQKYSKEELYLAIDLCQEVVCQGGFCVNNKKYFAGIIIKQRDNKQEIIQLRLRNLKLQPTFYSTKKKICITAMKVILVNLITEPKYFGLAGTVGYNLTNMKRT